MLQAIQLYCFLNWL